MKRNKLFPVNIAVVYSRKLRSNGSYRVKDNKDTDATLKAYETMNFQRPDIRGFGEL